MATTVKKTKDIISTKRKQQTVFSARTLVMLPTYNERENIENIVPQILAQNEHLGIVIVDDSSPDGTGQLADDLAKKHTGRIFVIHRKKRGRGSAGIDGFKFCLKQDVDCIIEMDADFSHDPKDIPRMLEAIKNCDIVVGSRNVPGGKQLRCTMFHRFISSVANIYNRILLGLPVKDNTGGFKCYRRSALQKINLNYLISKEYSIGAELLFRARQRKLRIKEIPIVFRNRVYGESKGTWAVIVNYPLTILKLRFISFVDKVREHVHYTRYGIVYNLIKESKEHNHPVLLDIGCGRPCDSMEDGSFVKFITKKGFHAQGLDIRTDMTIDFPFNQGSIYQMPFKDNHFDVIVAMEIFEHIDEPEKAISEVKRCLKKNGIFIMSSPTDSWFQKTFWWFWERTFGGQWHETHVHVMTPQKWVQLFKKYFTIKRFIHYWRGMAFIIKMINSRK
ncbi:glycosyltransferase [Candidatus Woesearchaeota archaeon]|nr:glycosyltransferase [Candidatus Woesearchaeota archaeon]